MAEIGLPQTTDALRQLRLREHDSAAGVRVHVQPEGDMVDVPDGNAFAAVGLATGRHDVSTGPERQEQELPPQRPVRRDAPESVDDSEETQPKLVNELPVWISRPSRHGNRCHGGYLRLPSGPGPSPTL